MKKSLSLFLVLTMILTMLGSFGIVASAEVPEGYTEITSAQDFVDKIKADPAGNYYLTTDIDLTTVNYSPIANFSGSLIGSDATNLKTINLNINETLTASASVGLFRTFGGSSVGEGIKNIRLTGSVTVSASSAVSDVYVGALIGSFTTDQNTTNISNIVNEVDITIGSNIGGYMGGIIGLAYGGSDNGITASNLVNKGDVIQTGDSYSRLGGVIGVHSMALTSCENYGTITAANGIAAGISANAYQAVSNCYNTGNITSTSSASRARNAGGIVCAISGSGNVTGCYNIGTVTVSDSSDKAYQIASASTNSGYLGTTASANDSGATMMTAAEMKTAVASTAPAAFLAALEDAEWIGYEKITTPAEFQAITADGKYRIMNDIDLTTISYSPIANFNGTLIGNNASDLPEIKVAISDAQTTTGLFRQIGGNAVIKNIKITGSVTNTNTSAPSVGALAGSLSSASTTTGSFALENIVNEASVTVTAATGVIYVGGILGDGANVALDGTVSNVINKANVSVTASANTDSYVGGLSGRMVAYNGKVLISSCGNEGNVSTANAVSWVGGLIGRLMNYTSNSVKMTNCYNTGNISGGTLASGIAGELSANVVLEYCYNTGDVSTAASGNLNCGAGIVYNGRVNGTMTPSISNCYNAGRINGNWIGRPVASSSNITVANCGYLGSSDIVTNATGMTLAQLKALSGAPAAFLNALNSIYAVTVSSADETMGTVSPSGVSYVKAGDDLKVTVTPNDGYQIADVKLNGASVVGNNGVYSLQISADSTVAASFEVRPNVEPTVSNKAQYDKADGVILFGEVSVGYGYDITDWGVIYSTANDTNGIKLSGNKGKALTSAGQYGIQMLFSGATYYVTPYVTFGDGVDAYGTTVEIAK